MEELTKAEVETASARMKAGEWKVFDDDEKNGKPITTLCRDWLRVETLREAAEAKLAEMDSNKLYNDIVIPALRLLETFDLGPGNPNTLLALAKNAVSKRDSLAAQVSALQIEIEKHLCYEGELIVAGAKIASENNAQVSALTAENERLREALEKITIAYRADDMLCTAKLALTPGPKEGKSDA